jgi:hypothetical protein
MSNRGLAWTLPVILVAATAAGVRCGEARMKDRATAIPKSVQLEHHEIHSALEAAAHARRFWHDRCPETGTAANARRA